MAPGSLLRVALTFVGGSMAMRVRKEASVLEEIIWASADDEAATENTDEEIPIMPVLSSDVNPIGSGTIHGRQHGDACGAGRRLC